MSTNADIIMKTEDGYKSIYLHWDGYPDHAFKTLVKHYSNDDEKVKRMIELGDISVLDKSIACPDTHTFETPVEGFTIFYGRDRGEYYENVRPEFSTTLERLKNNQYSYLYEDGEWKII